MTIRPERAECVDVDGLTPLAADCPHYSTKPLQA